MSTSALSHALSRLRVSLNDPLFYREGHRMCPSVYATQLAPVIASALKYLDRELSPQPEFDPAISTACLQIAITDFTAFCIFPALMNTLQHAARLASGITIFAAQPGVDGITGRRGGSGPDSAPLRIAGTRSWKRSAGSKMNMW